MAEIFSFTARKRKPQGDYPVIEKVVEGEVIECVNVDALTPDQRAEYFAAGERR